MCHTGGGSASLSPASGREGPGGLWREGLYRSAVGPMSQPWIHGVEEKKKRLWGRTHQIVQNLEGRKQIRQSQALFNGTQYKTRSNGLTQEVPPDNEEELFYCEGNQAPTLCFVITVSNTSAL